MLRAVAHNDLAGAVGELIVRLEFFRNCLPQLRNSGAGCVFCETGLEGLDRRRFDVLGRVEIGFTRAEAANIDALGFHRFSFAIDGKGQGRS